eukprot:10039324-Alexandrium_andersonii.AAC.1
MSALVAAIASHPFSMISAAHAVACHTPSIRFYDHKAYCQGQTMALVAGVGRSRHDCPRQCFAF